MVDRPNVTSPTESAAPARAGTRRWAAVLAVLSVVGVVALTWPRPSAPASIGRPPVDVAASAPTFTPEAVAPLPSDEPAPAASPEGTAIAVPVNPAPAAPAVAVAAPPRSTPRPALQVVRVRIPALGVDAPIQQMGFDSAGVMEVPGNATTVAWYGFTAMPGDPGNAVLAGHVTWSGARAVFNQLSALHAGDTVEVRTGDGDLRYVVQRSYLVKPEEADLRAIIGPRDGPQTLTIITCGGSFDPTVREYDHRVIVFATRA